MLEQVQIPEAIKDLAEPSDTPPATHKKKGRPLTEYTDELGERVCELIRGKSCISLIGEDPANGLPSKKILYRWLEEKASFRADYARACQARADARADRIDEIAADLEAGDIEPARARTLFDIERWQAGKENPRKYGDKTVIEGGDNPIVVRDEMSQLEVAKRILLALDKGRQIEGQADEVEATPDEPSHSGEDKALAYQGDERDKV